MQETDNWLTDYGNAHRELNFPLIYWVSVMTVVMATVGMLWSLPVPEEFARISPVLNWGSIFLMAAVVYYFIISMALAIGMLPVIFAMVLGFVSIADSDWSLPQLSAGLFALSLTGLYLGHISGPGLAGVVRDIQMMMIAPVWLLSRLYRHVGIPY